MPYTQFLLLNFPTACVIEQSTGSVHPLLRVVGPLLARGSSHCIHLFNAGNNESLQDNELRRQSKFKRFRYWNLERKARATNEFGVSGYPNRLFSTRPLFL